MHNPSIVPLLLGLLSLSLPGCLASPDDDLGEPEALALDDDPTRDPLALAGDLTLTLPEGTTLHPQRSWEDEMGQSHVRIHQSIDDIPVFGGEAIVHLDDQGEPIGITDALRPHVDVSTTPSLSEAQAVERAVDLTGGPDRLSQPPRATLTILHHAGRDHLAYQVQLRHMQPGDEPARPVVFIDAHDGETIHRYDALTHAALTHAYRTTWDMHGSTKFGGATVGDSSDAVLAETHHSLGVVTKFLGVKLGRSSYDGAGSTLNAYAHYGSNYMNAFWDGGAGRMVLGDGDGVLLSHLGKRDVVAHEVAHAIIDHEAALVPSGESGALAEATGDMLAARVADYANDDWVFDIGEDCWLPLDPTVALRYMGHPSDDGSSRDHYSDRYQGAADSGGIHFNAGIANHFFYLLSEGGQHHDPAFRSGLVVSGIGIEDAFSVWYRALTVYMVSTTDFADARVATVLAATDLYGPAVAEQVATAWHEVGVGKAP